MNPKDKRWTEMALKDTAADIVQPVDAGAAARELARCSVAVVSRLHAGILAAVSDTPVISLEYQRKCRDFALSIDNAQFLIRTDELSAAAVVDKVGSALVDSSNIRIKTRAAVTHLRQRLQTEYATLRQQLGLDGE
jgi:polysaccharide pyruvyl transferase WcaK-like protein